MSIFTPTDILLPNDDVSLGLWSVVACDQYTSERVYWERIKERVGDSPSTLNMIIPEAYLDEIDEEAEIKKIKHVMEDYINRGVFREIKDSYIYVERTQSNGQIRKGLVGALDLEKYSFLAENIDTETDTAAVVASEGTILDRLPPRVRVRQAASLELPHIMVFIADKNQTIIEPLAKKLKELEPLYDFELMEGGGHLRGTRISGSDSKDVMKALNVLHEEKKAQNSSQCLMIVGDGNHSLAAAKTYWNEVKKDLSIAEMEEHPARYALVEINNLFDPEICFEAIHRVVNIANIEKFVSAISTALAPAKSVRNSSKEASKQKSSRGKFNLQVLTPHSEKTLEIDENSAGELIERVQKFLDEYMSHSTIGKIDYIHDTDTLAELVEVDNYVGILLPTITKQEFLETVSAGKIFPRKSFSIGHAEDKRYYMECRKLRVES